LPANEANFVPRSFSEQPEFNTTDLAHLNVNIRSCKVLKGMNNAWKVFEQESKGTKMASAGNSTFGIQAGHETWEKIRPGFG